MSDIKTVKLDSQKVHWKPRNNRPFYSALLFETKSQYELDTISLFHFMHTEHEMETRSVGGYNTRGLSNPRSVRKIFSISDESCWL